MTADICITYYEVPSHQSELLLVNNLKQVANCLLGPLGVSELSDVLAHPESKKLPHLSRALEEMKERYPDATPYAQDREIRHGELCFFSRVEQSTGTYSWGFHWDLRSPDDKVSPTLSGSVHAAFPTMNEACEELPRHFRQTCQDVGRLLREASSIPWISMKV